MTLQRDTSEETAADEADGLLSRREAIRRLALVGVTAGPAALARAEGEVGLRTFFDRFPQARPAGTGSRRDTRVLRGWSTLPVALGPARSMAPVDV